MSEITSGPRFGATTAGPRPEAIKAIPVRHPGRWVSAVVVLLLVGQIVYTILGAHTMHVVAATGESAVLAVIAFLPHRFHDEQRMGVVASGLYWNFVVGSWLLLFAVLYLGPRLL